MHEDPFKEYMKEAEPNKREKGYAWYTAIGLQAVDGLSPSAYLIETAQRHIEGDISFNEVEALLQSYYEANPEEKASRTEEADKVSARIAALISDQAFTFSASEYISIHKKLFEGIYSEAGCIRNYNITKKEWILDGASVIYGNAPVLRDALEYDITEEKKFSYRNLTMDETIHHLAIFVARLWQIHVFGEGNTRATAVFFIKYLRTLGFEVTNDIFAKHAWYFRNALVRANYNHLKNGVYETTEYLELFLRNLLLEEDHILSNRMLYIGERVAAKESRNLVKESYFVVEVNGPLSLDEVMTTKEASERWGVSQSSITQSCSVQKDSSPRFRGNEYRKSGSTWLVTKAGMERLYGKEVENR